MSPEQLYIKSPVIALLEANNENIMAGLGQCIAEMVAAQLYNQAEGNDITAIYGVLPSGIFWKFMKLAGNTIYIDLRDYSLEDKPEKIIGMLSAMMKQSV